MQQEVSAAENSGAARFNAAQNPSTFRVDVSVQAEPEVAAAKRFEEELDNALDHHAKLTKAYSPPSLTLPLATVPDDCYQHGGRPHRASPRPQG